MVVWLFLFFKTKNEKQFLAIKKPIAKNCISIFTSKTKN